MEYVTENVRISLLMDDYSNITGMINIIGYKKLSDFMNQNTDQFLKMTEVRIGQTYTEFALINKNKIMAVL